MIANKALVAVAMISALGATSATASDHRPRERGFVMPCSLDGVNPTYHPDIFGSAAAARSYGFVRSGDGAWHVMPNCRRW
jgi:hypothetical protein